MKKFKKTYIEITNKCNLSCQFCPKTLRQLEFMSEDLFRLILDKIKGHSEYLFFHVLGEPLLHPQIGLFLDICEENGYKVTITTNGTLIKKNNSKILGKSALRQINFSIHSFEANKSHYTLNEYLNDIFEFINTSLESENHIISLRLWNLEENINNIHNEYILNWIQQKFDIKYSLINELKNRNSLKIKDNLYINQAQKFEWPDINSNIKDEVGICQGLKNQIAILVDGTVVPCCLDGEGIVNLGNIKNSELNEILNSIRAQKIVSGFMDRKISEELCRKCSYRTRFNKK